MPEMNHTIERSPEFNKEKGKVGISMEIFDLMKMEAKDYQERVANVFYQNDLFKTRIIVLGAQGKIPACEMESYVLFYVVKGEILLRKNDETTTLKENELFITEPALLSMESTLGTRLLGIQIKVRA